MPRNRDPLTMFQQHVHYEIEQLAISYWRLKSGIKEQEFVNLYHESFCIHAKTLLEFFIRTLQRDMAAAADFTNPSYVRPKRERGTDLDEILGRLNTEVSHLSWARPDNQSDQIGPDYRDKIWTVVKQELQRWVQHLQKGFDQALLPLSLLSGLQIDTLPTLAPASATNVVSGTTLKIV